MKNKFKMRSILAIAIAVVIGFTMTTCDLWEDEEDEGSGTFTITNIPAQYEGMYAGFVRVFEYRVSSGILCGFKSYNKKTDTYTLCRISNGRVSMPVWDGNKQDAKRYSGSITTTSVPVRFTDSETTSWGGVHFSIPIPCPGVTFDSVKFSGGSATKSYND